MTVQSSESSTNQNAATSPARVLFLALSLVGLSIAAGFAAANQMVLVATAMVLGVMVLVLLKWPDTATPLVTFLLYSNVVVLGVRFHGVPSFASALVPVMLLLPMFYHLVMRREPLILPRSLPWVILFMIVLMISTIFSSNFTAAFGELLVYITEGFLLYLFVINSVRSSQHMRHVIWGLLAAGILMGAVPLYQQITGDFNNNYGGLAQISDASFRTGEENLQGEVRQPRLAGAVGEINRFAQVMLILVPLGLFRFWGETSRLLRVLALLAAVLAGLGMVLAFSRGAAVAFALMILLMVFFRVIKPIQMVGFVLVAGLLLFAMPQYSARILSIQSITGFFRDDVASEETSPDGAIEGRATVMLAAALVYADHPVLGVGPGMFKYYAREYSHDLGLKTLTGEREAHSLYLGMAAETGTLGLIFFFGMIAVTVIDLYRVRKRSRGVRPDLENLATSFILVLLAYLTTGLFLHLSYMRYFWLIFALASAASTIALKELEPSSIEPAATSFPYGRVI